MYSERMHARHNSYKKPKHLSEVTKFLSGGYYQRVCVTAWWAIEYRRLHKQSGRRDDIIANAGYTKSKQVIGDACIDVSRWCC